MSILSDFEDRVSSAIEGLFAGAFRSPVQPVELARALSKAMDDGRMVGVAKVYAPTAYTLRLSLDDFANLRPFAPVLGDELATYLEERARENAYYLASRPTLTFAADEFLRMGRFTVTADHTPTEGDATAVPPAPGSRSSDAVAPIIPPLAPATVAADPEPAEVPAPRPTAPDPATDAERPASVTIGEATFRIPLSGERVLVGRLEGCGIQLADQNASRKHAEFVHGGSGWWIADLGSRNGVVLNGERVERQRVHDGDVIEVGLTKLVFHQPEV